MPPEAAEALGRGDPLQGVSESDWRSGHRVGGVQDKGTGLVGVGRGWTCPPRGGAGSRVNSPPQAASGRTQPLLVSGCCPGSCSPEY